MASNELVNIGTVTILNGASLSGAIVLPPGLRPVAVIGAGTWTAGAITFQASIDGTNFYSMWDQSAEVSIASGSVGTAAANYMVLDPAKFLGVRAIKLRSGTSGTPVNQGGDRVLTIIAREMR